MHFAKRGKTDHPEMDQFLTFREENRTSENEKSPMEINSFGLLGDKSDGSDCFNLFYFRGNFKNGLLDSGFHCHAAHTAGFAIPQ